MSDSGDREALRRRLEEIVHDARASGIADELPALFAEALRAPASSTAARRPALAKRTASSTSEGVTVDPVTGIPSRFGMIGDSPPMRVVFDLIEKVAASHVSVLIQGETGTGKELVARALHDNSSRKGKMFLAENCAAVPANLLESELFGHTRGSFTGAIGDRDGHFVAADGGTVFLDEIGDMPLAMQSKLLRVLQEGEVRPVGSNKTLKVDVRILAASNKDLAAMVRTKSFREDLYFRLNVVTIRLPPLRERTGDVRHLARAFAARMKKEVGRPIHLTEEAIEALSRWSWPGNVRELENSIRRAAVFAKDEVGPQDLPAPIGTGV